MDRTILDLPAYRDDRGHMHAWCRYCACWHHHGIGGGLRVAHCLPAASPYWRTGYTLVPSGPFTEAVRRGRRIRRLRRCPGCYEAIPFAAGLERCPSCKRPLPATWRDSDWLGRPDSSPVEGAGL